MSHPRKLLVLDLDETLIHAREEPLDRAPDFEFGTYFIYRRPHLDEFLAYALKTFDVGVWTSSGSAYAHHLTRQVVDPAALRFVWASRRCTLRRDFSTGDYHPLKRLAKLKPLGYRLSDIIAVDDTPEKHKDNYGNLVRVSEFTGDPADRELLLLKDYLDRLALEPNIRAVEKRNWQARFYADAE